MVERRKGCGQALFEDWSTKACDGTIPTGSEWVLDACIGRAYQCFHAHNFSTT